MPAYPMSAQSQTAHNAIRHGLASERFFLLPDEDPDAYAGYEAMWLRMSQKKKAARSATPGSGRGRCCRAPAR